MPFLLTQPNSLAASEQSIDAQALEEPGCPISIQSLQACLEIDPFQAPVALRVYLNYKNNGEKTIEAIKFRFRANDAQGQNKGTYQASDTHLVAPGQTASEKLRREGIDPQTKTILVRVLQIRFSDQSGWQSTHQPASAETPQPEVNQPER